MPVEYAKDAKKQGLPQDRKALYEDFKVQEKVIHKNDSHEKNHPIQNGGRA